MLDKKLQLKDGQTIAIMGSPAPLPLAATLTDMQTADAVMVFAVNEAALRQQLDVLQQAAGTDKLVWLAYPKTKQLGTDLNRDIIRDLANQNGLDPVRQIAIDDIWSALRLKKL